MFPIALLAVVTALSFANAWPDTVVLDDKFFVNNPNLPDWSEPEELFKGDVWRTTTANSGLFRPALFISLSIDSRLFGGWLAGYHISNIVLHFAVSLGLYGFLLQLLRALPDRPRRADVYALLTALVFAVHPVHTEVVNSVFNRSDMLVTLGGVLGLWWLLHFLRRNAALAWAGFALFYLLAMLSKETGVVLPGIAVALIAFLSDEPWGRRIRQSLQATWMLLPLALYFYLRSRALSAGAAEALEGSGAGRAGAGLSIASPEQILATLGLWGEGLRLMIWPHPLKLHYHWPEMPAWAALIAAQAALLVVGLLHLRKGRSALLAGLAWFYLALLPAARLIVPGGGDTVGALAERHLYFASAGPALVLALSLTWLGHRYGARRILLPVMLAVLVMMPLTWNRNNDWRTDVRLFEKEYRLSGADSDTLRLLTAAHQKRGNHARGAEICDRHPDLLGRYSRFTLNCGMLYASLGRTRDAVDAYLSILEEEGDFAGASGNLAIIYLQQGRIEEAAEQFKRAIESERDPAVKIMRRGLMIAYLYPKDPRRLLQAKAYFDAAFELQPMMGEARRFSLMMEQAIENLRAEASGHAPAQSDPGSGTDDDDSDS